MAEISIGFLSKRSGFAHSTLRYYEDMGLLSPNRTRSGQRRYPKSDMRRVAFIKAAQSFGYTLPQIKEILSILPDKRTPTLGDWQTLSANFKTELDRKIRALEKLRDTLDGCIGCGCLSLSTCQLYNKDDWAGQQGDGAQFLKEA